LLRASIREEGHGEYEKLTALTGAAFALLWFCLGLAAQERFSTIAGTVRDASDALVPGVKVTLENTATRRIYEATTGADGSFVALNLEPGTYSARFERQGFTTKKLDVNLLVGKALRIDTTLQSATLRKRKSNEAAL
jgi:hypothetical protein